MTHPLEPMLRPKSVAVIGASNTPSRIGGRPIHAMKTAGYKGKIYPINPNYETIQDLPAYAKIQDVPKDVDCAIIAVSAKVAVQTLRDCADHGVKSAVMFTSGFAEQSEEGAEAQREISEIARTSGMRIVGPNCLGVFNISTGWYGTFSNAPGALLLPPGPIGIVSQSGAYGAHVFAVSQLRGVGANYWVTTGNESDVDVAEVIEYYAQNPEVKVILAYAEGMKNADRVCSALEKARDAEKPVIFMKVGKTEAGAAAAASHTASLAGADAVYDALFKQYGVYRAETTEEFVDIAYACQFGKYPKGRKIDLQTISGGVGVQMADASVK
ncbi:CoA-binding protein, partial [uncultured Sneathiella sp.]|uniref:CoA-binding protein n=1 Tax=uncultured Sneathiella sp. TaxID=879315 RepID=UPI0030D92CE9